MQEVATSVQLSMKFPNAGERPVLKIATWGVLVGVLVALTLLLVLTRRRASKGRAGRRSSSRLLLVAVLGACVVGGGSYELLISRLDPGITQGAETVASLGWKIPIVLVPPGGSYITFSESVAHSDIRNSDGIPQGLPVRLKIPVIGVDSAIEDALITPDGRMDMPTGSVNVAWFSLGPFPGQVGSAVIGGHFGMSHGVPFVFYDLNKLRVGDKVYVLDDMGETLAFQVRSTKSLDRNADATTVFTSQDGAAHLNLITCDGIWNKVDNMYPQRLVVFTDAIPAEGAVVVKTTPQVVVAPVTTRPPIPTALPSASKIPVATQASSRHVFNLVAATFYATPLDAFITSLLLISEAFVVVLMIRMYAAPSRGTRFRP